MGHPPRPPFDLRLTRTIELNGLPVLAGLVRGGPRSTDLTTRGPSELVYGLLRRDEAQAHRIDFAETPVEK
jgi:hypothetical protein